MFINKGNNNNNNSITDTVQTLQEWLPVFMARGHGHIVSLSSIAGLSGCKNLVPYCASKHAVKGTYSSCKMLFSRQMFNTKFEISYIFPCQSCGCSKKIVEYWSEVSSDSLWKIFRYLKEIEHPSPSVCISPSLCPCAKYLLSLHYIADYPSSFGEKLSLMIGSVALDCNKKYKISTILSFVNNRTYNANNNSHLQYIKLLVYANNYKILIVVFY